MSDYDRIASAMAYLADRATNQPSLDEIAAHVHLSPYHIQRMSCHRVILKTGALGGYRWGPAKKLMVQTWERMRDEPVLLQQSHAIDARTLRG